MKLLDYIRLIPASFYNVKRYQEILMERNFRRFTFLILALFILYIPRFVAFSIDTNKFLKGDIEMIIRQIPDIQISGGKASSSVQQPYSIYDSTGTVHILLLDTTGTITDPLETDALLFISEDRITARNSTSGEVRTYDLSQVNGYFQIDSWTASEWVRKTVPWIYILGLLLPVPWFFLIKVIGILIITSLARLIKLNKDLDFYQTATVATLAAVPAYAAKTLMLVLPVHLQGTTLINWAFVIVYSFMMIRKVKPLDHQTIDM